MGDNHPILLSALTGFISGLLLSIPVGPVNLTIINEGARRGLNWALMISLGAAVMEVIYCALAFTGFAQFFDNRVLKAAMEVFSFVFMLFLGVKFLLAKTVSAVTHLSATADRLEESIGKKLHPHSAFMTGFVRVMGNPGVLLFWIILAASFISHEWVQPNLQGKIACVTGVALGTGLWFAGLSYGMSRGHGRMSEKTLLRMEHISGLALVLFGLGQGVRIVFQLVHHKL
jgi:threonine/homoserine/homoserine lactone efflux protein